MPSRVRERWLRRRPRGDAGVTLIELMVAMGLMTVFMVMFTGGVLQIYSATSRSEANIEAQTKVNLAVARLDTEIRYASKITEPGKVGNVYYAEYETTNYGARTCTQLRLDPATHELKRRTWVPPANPPTWASTGRPLLADVYTADPEPPFARPPANGSGPQQLSLRLSTESGAGGTTRVTTVDITFTAVNSNARLDDENDTACVDGRTKP